MGAVQSDLKANIVQASSGTVVIPANLKDFWQTFWQRPETAEHVFETITPSDIRTMRDGSQSFKNLETLILTVSYHLIHLRDTAESLADNHAQLGKEVLNCVRILTRVLPFVYEADSVRDWEQKIFWEESDVGSLKPLDNSEREGSPGQETVGVAQRTVPGSGQQSQPRESLGSTLIEALLDFAFWSGFTLPVNSAGKNGPTYGFWQSGIAYERRLDTSKEFESRRTEIMQLLLVLESKSIYRTTNEYLQSGGEAVECISNHSDRKKVQYLLCSLLNTIVKYQPDARYIRYGESPREVHETHVRTCLDFLLINLLNRAPWQDENEPAPDNRFRELFSHLHKATHLQFLADGILKILRQPLEASGNAFHIVQRPLTWAHEIIPLLWEALYCNKYFRAFICETGRQYELVVFLLFYLLDPNMNMEGVTRVSVLCLQALSESSEFAHSLNKSFEGHDNLPSFMQIKNFHGSYADYLITWLLTLLKPDTTGRINTLAASLAAVVVNISPFVTNLGRATSLKMVQVIDNLSRNPGRTGTEINAMSISNLMQAINTMVEEQKAGHENDNVLWAIWKFGGIFERLADIKVEVDQDFRSLLKGLREKGIVDPIQCPDGAVLVPIVPAENIIGLRERPRPRNDGRTRIGDGLDFRGSPAVIPSLSKTNSLDASYSPPATDGLQADGEKVSLTMTSKAQGKKPEVYERSLHAPSERRRSIVATASLGSLTGSLNGNDLVHVWYQQMPLCATITVIMALDAWTMQVLDERAINASPEALNALTIADVLAPVREVGSICIEPGERSLHRFLIQPPFTAMYAAFYWGLVASQDVERAAVAGSGIWSSTKIKLFRIKAGRVQAPSLFSPKGAVDAVGESLVTGLQNLTMKARQGLASTGAQDS